MRDYTVEFYTLKPLPTKYRASFTLKGNPYRSIEGLKDIDEFQPIFFRDEYRPNGVIIDQDGQETRKRTGFTAYKYMVKMETDNKTICRVGKWKSGKTHRIHKDPYAWSLWGREVEIEQITDTTVKVVK